MERFLRADGSETQPLCFQCGEASAEIQYDYPDMKIVRCLSCGLWRSCPRYSARQLDAYYREQHYSPEREAAGAYEQWRERNAGVWAHNARLVLNEAKKRGLGRGGVIRVLDIGTGHGFFIDECVKVGLAARGIETSPDAVRYATQTLRTDVRNIPLEALPAVEHYEVITLWGVLEHVPDPLATLRRAREHLVEGGMLWVMTPNTNALERFIKGANYFNFLNKSHLTHFHRKTLKAMLEKAGYRNVQRYIHFGGGARRGPAEVAQYVARVLCLGTELRFIGEKL
jgi:2-polyprenyl-3-methyl-5-hydroxy-6-metoxy-1,4-benzoquinol methylase